jgi:hypothetical protein
MRMTSHPKRTRDFQPARKIDADEHMPAKSRESPAGFLESCRAYPGRWSPAIRDFGLVMVSRNCIPPGPCWFRDARRRVWQTAPCGAAAAY